MVHVYLTLNVYHVIAVLNKQRKKIHINSEREHFFPVSYYILRKKKKITTGILLFLRFNQQNTVIFSTQILYQSRHHAVRHKQITWTDTIRI